jgi:hypothetical protein
LIVSSYTGDDLIVNVANTFVNAQYSKILLTGGNTLRVVDDEINAFVSPENIISNNVMFSPVRNLIFDAKKVIFADYNFQSGAFISPSVNLR